MNSSTGSNSGANKLAPSAIKWRHWPLRDEWKTHLPVAGVVAFAILAVGLGTQEIWVTLGTVAIVLVVLWRWWLPVEYEIGAKGLSQRILNRTHLTPWRNIRRFDARPHGVMLFSQGDATPLDPLRGLFVPYGTHREEILENLAFHVGQNRESGSERRHTISESTGKSSQ